MGIGVGSESATFPYPPNVSFRCDCNRMPITLPSLTSRWPRVGNTKMDRSINCRTFGRLSRFGFDIKNVSDEIDIRRVYGINRFVQAETYQHVHFPNPYTFSIHPLDTDLYSRAASGRRKTAKLRAHQTNGFVPCNITALKTPNLNRNAKMSLPCSPQPQSRSHSRSHVQLASLLPFLQILP